tara:strand:- start:630 stop:1250 length:621 start_codon:yes stop_codon:yes gene_type:complete
MHKNLPILAVVAAIFVLVSMFLPEGGAKTAVSVLALLSSGGVAAFLFSSKAAGSKAESVAVAPEAEPSKPDPGQAKGSAEAEVITFLGMLQDKGRFIDFLMEDISGADDAQLGAVARVVHQGCSGVLSEHLKVDAVESTAEGGSVTLPDGYEKELYRLSGNLSGSAPFQGTLVHKGWKVASINLPKVIESGKAELPPLAPAQVEVK